MRTHKAPRLASPPMHTNIDRRHRHAAPDIVDDLVRARVGVAHVGAAGSVVRVAVDAPVAGAEAEGWATKKNKWEFMGMRGVAYTCGVMRGRLKTQVM